jgi:spermidine synthase
LGFGAGSVYRLVRETFGEKVKIRGVELDPVMIQIYHDYFKKESDQIQIIQDDVLSYMHRQTETYDMILIDVFIGENIPETVFADSFVYAVEKALNLNGILLWNTIVDSEKQNIKFNHLINLLQAKDSWFVLNEINRMIYKRNTK